MQNKPTQQEERLTIGESSEYLGVSIDTLRRWEKKGVITTVRSPGGHRYFFKKDLDKLFGQKYTRAISTLTPEEKIKKPVISVIPAKEEKEVIPPVTQKPQVNSQVISNVLIPPTVTPQPPIQNIPNDQPVSRMSQPKKEISWTTIIIIGLILFTVIDLVLLIVYLTSSQPLATPIP